MRFAALDSSASWPDKAYGPSFAGEAEHVLDRITTEVLTRGWGANTVRCKKYTSVGAGIAFATAVLRIVPAGPTQFKNIVYRGGAAYDLENDTATFPAGDYFFDILTDHDFATLPTDIQVLIIKEAKSELQSKMKQNPNVQGIIEMEKGKAEIGADRPRQSGSSAPINQQPLVMQQQGQQRQ